MHPLVAETLDLLFPPRCAACDALLRRRDGLVAAAFCPACALTLEPLPARACPRCGEPAAGEAGCPACRVVRPAFDATVVVGLHGGALQDAVHALKYGDRPELAGPLGRLVAAAVRRAGEVPDLVVPVPLHPARLRQRGYDQADLLAAAVAGALRRPLVRALRRARPTAPQVGASRAARRTNLAGAFGPAGRWDSGSLRDRVALLVDDVVTTGATASAAARVVRDRGACRVVVGALARTE
jgi:ComF family protein